MKVGIDARFYGPAGTGIGRTLVKLLQNLENIDDRDDYVVFLKKNNWDLYQPQNPRFKKVLADIPWYTLQEQLLLPRIFGRENLDLLHVPHINIPIFYSGRLVVTIHDLIISEYKNKEMTTRNLFFYKLQHFGYGEVLRQAVKKSVKIMVPTQATKKQIQTQFPTVGSKIEVINEAADEVFSQGSKNTKEVLEKYSLQKPYLLYVGNSFPYKNVGVIIKALKSLDKDLKLFMPSPQNKFLERIKDLAQETGVAERVLTPGYVTDTDLATVYKEASAYIFPSLAEGFGLPGLEAMSVGLPVIASDIEVLKEVYGEAAIYFDPKDPEDLAGRVKLLLEEKKIRDKYIDLGYEQAKKYSWEKYARETLYVYQQSLKQ